VTRRRISLGGAVVATLAALSLPGAAAAAFQEAPCQPEGFLCSRVVVPLDRSGAVDGTVALDVRRLPAADAPTPTALVAVLGGPGQPATPVAGELAAELGAARAARDLIVTDPRGVGRSGALRCRSQRVSRCAAELGRARGLYTTAADVADLEALRVAGGYERLLLYGTSYGTKVALQYAAAHPERVERLVLDSVVTPEGPDPLQLSTFAAIRRVLPELCGGGACRSVTGDPTRDLAAVVRQLARRSLVAPLVTSSGRRVRVRLTPTTLLDVLVGGDLNPIVRAETPAAIRAARRGDGAPLARLALRTGRLAAAALQHEDPVNRVRNAATICEETRFPWRRSAGPAVRAEEAAARIRRLRRAQVAPFTRITALTGGLLPLCVRWPVASPAPPASFALPPGIPALVLSGEQDLRTPLEDARRVAARLGPTARVLAVPTVGHSVLGADPSGCATAALAAFLADGPVGPCGPADRLLDPPRVPPRSLASVSPYRGVGGRAGRTLAASSRTVADAQRALAANRIAGRGGRVGGLRAGTATAQAAGVRLRGYSYVPGVTVSGLLPEADGAPFRLTIRGRSAARGTITVSGGRIAGRLGGQPIDVATSPPAARAAHAPRDRDATAPFPRLARIP
jgi:pimeloyl-ACP methyl ester carboxylesterase